MDAAGGGVNNADADADSRPGVATSVRVPLSVGVAATVCVPASVASTTASVDVTTASVAVTTASVAVPTATAVTNSPAATRTDAAAEARDATLSSWPDAASGYATTGSVATERRGIHGGICGGQPAVLVAADGVGTPAESPATAGASGRVEGVTATPQPGDARRGRISAGADGAARSTAGETRSRRSGGGTRGKRPRPSEAQEVEPPYAAHDKSYRVGSIAPEGDALRAHLAAAAVNRLAAAGGAPAGAVELAISRVRRNGVDRLHAPLQTSSDSKVGEAMDGVVKVVKELRRATHMEDDIGRILNEVRAADRVAPADERFVYDDSDESGGSRPTGPRRRHR